MTESTIRYMGRDVVIHTTPEGLDRVARMLVELGRRAPLLLVADGSTPEPSGTEPGG